MSCSYAQLILIRICFQSYYTCRARYRELLIFEEHLSGYCFFVMKVFTRLCAIH
jgi:hypothetical protein